MNKHLPHPFPQFIVGPAQAFDIAFEQGYTVRQDIPIPDTPMLERNAVVQAQKRFRPGWLILNYYFNIVHFLTEYRW